MVDESGKTPDIPKKLSEQKLREITIISKKLGDILTQEVIVEALGEEKVWSDFTPT